MPRFMPRSEAVCTRRRDDGGHLPDASQPRQADAHGGFHRRDAVLVRCVAVCVTLASCVACGRTTPNATASDRGDFLRYSGMTYVLSCATVSADHLGRRVRSDIDAANPRIARLLRGAQAYVVSGVSPRRALAVVAGDKNVCRRTRQPGSLLAFASSVSRDEQAKIRARVAGT